MKIRIEFEEDCPMIKVMSSSPPFEGEVRVCYVLKPDSGYEILWIELEDELK